MFEDKDVDNYIASRGEPDAKRPNNGNCGKLNEKPMRPGWSIRSGCPFLVQICNETLELRCKETVFISSKNI